MKHLLGERLTKLWRDRMGGVFVYAAIAAPVLIGAAGLSVDIGLWYANKRLVQSAVDSAALAGALELRRSDGDETSIVNAVNADAAINGFSAADGDTIDVDLTDSPEVEVIITRPTPGLLSQVLFTETTNVQARAVAQASVNDSCIWALNGSASGALTVSGSANVELGCGVIANSSDVAGIDENGTGCLIATEIKIVGGTEGDCVNPTAETGIAPVEDPLAALEAPSYTPCFGGAPPTILSGTADYALNPGVYCGNITINTGGTVTFNPGLYVLDGAALTINGAASVFGDDVSFYLTENNNNINDNITISGTGSVILSAPSDGPLPGILFYHDRNAGGNVTHNLTGGATMQLNGIIYFPTTDLKFTGGAELNESASIIIADEVTFTGEVHLGGFTTAPGNAILGNSLMLQANLIE
jgi:Flp pilus assembly protein TadG